MMVITHMVPDPSDGEFSFQVGPHWLAGAHSTASMSPATILNLDAWVKVRALDNCAKGLGKEKLLLFLSSH